MENELKPSEATLAFVVKPRELAILNYLPVKHPRPLFLEWINRGTDQTLRPTTIDLILRTLHNDEASPSVVKLHRSAGLRISFKNSADRTDFVRSFELARIKKEETSPHLVCFRFNTRASVERAIDQLKAGGVPRQAISLLWRAGAFANQDKRWLQGHSKLTVASAIAASGLAGSLLGFVAIAVPGVGSGVAAGIFAASQLSPLAAAGGSIGATGAAIAMLLSDPEVQDVSDAYLKKHSSNEMLIIAVDTRLSVALRPAIVRILTECGGKSWKL